MLFLVDRRGIGGTIETISSYSLCIREAERE